MTYLRDTPDGIPAICGGMMACGTCHVYIAAIWFDQLAPADASEIEMLDSLTHRKSLSRLSCQIALNSDLAGLEIELAPDE